MLPRLDVTDLELALADFPVVAILGPRQVGKTTLAHELGARVGKSVGYLDLELDSDRAILAEPELFLRRASGRLTILDEIQRAPELFPLLRALVDQRIRAGELAGHFLVLGSASPDLLRQSSESLAGRIAYHELRPLSTLEVGGGDPSRLEQLWLRGGFPRAFLARDDASSAAWRAQFIATYLERDLPQLGPRLPAELVRRTWTMLAHGQGTPLNAARLATGLAVGGGTVRRYVDLMTDVFLVRQLEPWTGKSAKRLTRAPKVYVRDSGLMHQLIGLRDMDTLLAHPILGTSWEGFAIEQVLAHASRDWRPSYYRTSAGAEIDLVLEHVDGRVAAIEVKRTSTPRLGKGFVLGCADVGATERWFAIPEGDGHPIGHETEAVGIHALAAKFARA